MRESVRNILQMCRPSLAIIPRQAGEQTCARYLASSIVRSLSLSVALSREDFRFIIVCSTSCRHGIKYLLHHSQKKKKKATATGGNSLYGQWECHKRWPIRCGCQLRMPMCELPMQCAMRTVCVCVSICVWVSLWRL